MAQYMVIRICHFANSVESGDWLVSCVSIFLQVSPKTRLLNTIRCVCVRTLVLRNVLSVVVWPRGNDSILHLKLGSFMST